MAQSAKALPAKYSVTVTPRRHHGVEGVSAQWSKIPVARVAPLPKRSESLYYVELSMLMTEDAASRLGWGRLGSEPSLADVARAAASAALHYGLADPRSDACAYSWVTALAGAVLPAPSVPGAPMDQKEVLIAADAAKAVFMARAVSAPSSAKVASDFGSKAADAKADAAFVCEGEAARLVAASGGKLVAVKIAGGMAGLSHELALENPEKEWMFDKLVKALRDPASKFALAAALGAPRARDGAKSPRWPLYTGPRDALLDGFDAAAFVPVHLSAVIDTEGQFDILPAIRDLAEGPPRGSDEVTRAQPGTYEIVLVGQEPSAPEVVSFGADTEAGRGKLLRLAQREAEKREAERGRVLTADAKKEKELLAAAGVGSALGDRPTCAASPTPRPNVSPAPIFGAVREAYKRSVERAKRDGTGTGNGSVLVSASRVDSSDPDGSLFEAWHRALPEADRKIPIDVVVVQGVPSAQYERLAKISGGSVRSRSYDSYEMFEPSVCVPPSTDFSSLKTPEELERLRKYEESLKSQAGQGGAAR